MFQSLSRNLLFVINEQAAWDTHNLLLVTFLLKTNVPIHELTWKLLTVNKLLKYTKFASKNSNCI